ncbi:HAD family hydrolase [Acholeplasma granularum]|uniref:HAD family hydrolase n=1 Tax=Acholeplasma granularum TaxID=264635 RepID=UPI000470526B|nr:HAD-IA family hydrolase [Acholeplasma granularum]
MIKVVIFDLDDTLIDERSFAFSAFVEISDELSRIINKTSNNIYKELVQLYEEYPNLIFNRILDDNSITYNEELISDLILKYRNHKPNIELSSDVKELLVDLRNKGIKLGLITDGFKTTQRNKVISLELEKYIDKIVITDELGPNREFWKPSEKPYTIIKEYFNVEYNEMVYIGDNINKDFIAPIKLGMKYTLYINENSHYQKLEQNKYLGQSINDLNEVLKLIR